MFLDGWGLPGFSGCQCHPKHQCLRQSRKTHCIWASAKHGVRACAINEELGVHKKRASEDWPHLHRTVMCTGLQRWARLWKQESLGMAFQEVEMIKDRSSWGRCNFSQKMCIMNCTWLTEAGNKQCKAIQCHKFYIIGHGWILIHSRKPMNRKAIEAS